MNLDPTGSPRHEQTVAVALALIIAWRAIGGFAANKPK
jgi:hypothetical protein